MNVQPQNQDIDLIEVATNNRDNSSGNEGDTNDYVV